MLYPSPNRVRDAQFQFARRTYQFPANNGKNFIHGLVHSVPWVVSNVVESKDRTELHCELGFKPGTERYKLFPHEHVLKLKITINDGAVRWTYAVENDKQGTPLPFGFALHPWFLHQGSRDNLYLTVPAPRVMDGEGMLRVMLPVRLKKPESHESDGRIFEVETR